MKKSIIYILVVLLCIISLPINAQANNLNKNEQPNYIDSGVYANSRLYDITDTSQYTNQNYMFAYQKATFILIWNDTNECIPMLESLQLLQEYITENNRNDIQVIGLPVSNNNNYTTQLDILNTHNITFKNYIKGNFTNSHIIEMTESFTEYPILWLIDTNGIIRDQINNPELYTLDELLTYLNSWYDQLPYPIGIPYIYPMLGDINIDNDITAIDALLILRYILGINTETFTPEQIYSMDINQDWNIDSNDALIVLRVAMGIILYPYPWYGH